MSIQAPDLQLDAPKENCSVEQSARAKAAAPDARCREKAIEAGQALLDFIRTERVQGKDFFIDEARREGLD